MSSDRTSIRRALADRRSGEVVFVSHCLLNQNTRYPGGAACPGAVLPAVMPYLTAGTGVVQMRCPEQRTWGGVTKRWLLWALVHPRVTRAATPLVGLARGYLRLRYARYARQVAAEVEDYLANGLRVVAVVGVAGSPTCGVHSTLNLHTAATTVGRCTAKTTRNAEWMNRVVVDPAVEPGRGLFIEALVQELRRRGIDVPIQEDRLTAGASPLPRHMTRQGRRNDDSDNEPTDTQRSTAP